MKERYARDIVSQFPYPIAITFARLRTSECLDPGPLRLQQIFVTAEAVTRFCGVVALCECRDQLERTEAALPPALARDFSERLARPSWGNWLHFGREGARWLREQGDGPVLPELIELFFDQRGREGAAATALGALLTLRNGLSHDRIKAMHRHEFQALCDQGYPALERTLEALGFLLDYELTFTSQIEVFKRRRRAPDFAHLLKFLNGDSDIFKGERTRLPVFLESQAVLLRPLEGSDRHLCLDPLLIYEEEAGAAADLFFFNGMSRPENAHYTACKQGGAFQLPASPNAGELSRELGELLELFGIQPAAAPAAGQEPAHVQ